MDGESGFEEAEVSEVSSGVTKVITRFIEKVRFSYDTHIYEYVQCTSAIIKPYSVI